MFELDREAYAAALRAFHLEPRTPCPVLFVGDSLTAGSEFDRRLPGARLRGIPGDEAELLITRLPELLELQPQLLFLLIGLNDLQRERPVGQVAGDVAACVDYIGQHAPATRLVLQSLVPSTSPQLEARITALNPLLRELAAGRGLGWLDLHAAFCDAGGVRDGLIADDHVHLMPAGYQAWLAALQPLLPR